MELSSRVISQEVFNKMLEYGHSQYFARVVSARVSSLDALEKVFNPKLSNFPSPSLLTDMDKAAQILSDFMSEAKSDKSLKVIFVCDYDVDGNSACAIMTRAFRDFFKFRSGAFIPYVCQKRNGYGFSEGALTDVMALIGSDVSKVLVITADLGSSDHLRVVSFQDMCRSKGIEPFFIVTDHHNIEDRILDNGEVAHGPVTADAFINPKRNGDAFPDKQVCGAVVAWMLMAHTRNILIEKGVISSKTSKINELLSFGAVATIGDMMGLDSELNRAIIKYGLNIINKGVYSCWSVFCEDFDSEIMEDTLGFQLSPRINAWTRMKKEGAAVQDFLCSDDAGLCQSSYRLLNSANTERKDFEKDVMRSVERQAEEQVSKGTRIIVCCSLAGASGVVGIAAGKLKEKYQLPVLVFSAELNSQIANGSGRSIEGVALDKLLHRLNKEHGVFQACGGHEQAVGASFAFRDASHLLEAAEFMRVVLDYYLSDLNREVFNQKLYVDGVVYEDFELPYLNLLDEFRRAAPFGQKFPAPCFAIKGQVTFFKEMGKGSLHCRLKINDELELVWFNFRTPNMPLNSLHGRDVIAVFTLNKNVFRGETKLQCLVQKLVFKS